MEANLLTFGDAFRYDNKYYVFLALNGDSSILYAAQILTDGQTKSITRLGFNSQCDDEANLLFCYVMLETESFKDRAAYFNQNEKESSGLIGVEKICSLDKKDLVKIKTQILESKAISKTLKDAVTDIVIE